MHHAQFLSLAIGGLAALLALGGATFLATAAPVPAPLATEKPPTPGIKEGRMLRLRQATLALILYVNENGNHFPNDFGATLPYADKKVGARAYVTPDDERKTQVPGDADAAWVNEHTSFVYLANSTTTWKAFDTPDGKSYNIPIAHEKFESHPGGDIAVAFIDGHVEWLPVEKAKIIVDDSKRVYSKS